MKYTLERARQVSHFDNILNVTPPIASTDDGPDHKGFVRLLGCGNSVVPLVVANDSVNADMIGSEFVEFECNRYDAIAVSRLLSGCEMISSRSI
jgi:hypothetical protein